MVSNAERAREILARRRRMRQSEIEHLRREIMDADERHDYRKMNFLQRVYKDRTGELFDTEWDWLHI